MFLINLDDGQWTLLSFIAINPHQHLNIINFFEDTEENYVKCGTGSFSVYAIFVMSVLVINSLMFISTCWFYSHNEYKQSFTKY